MINITYSEPKPESGCEHSWMFDFLRSYENGEGELYICTKCGVIARDTSDDMEDEDD